jgi:lipopolysaccharide export system ATP-binding protein
MYSNLEGCLQTIDITKTFSKKAVVKNISISVRCGEIIGLLGPNGAGKTTIFDIMMGTELPDSGKVMLEEHDITYLPIHKRAQRGVGYLPQETSIFRGLNVENNILTILELVERNRATRRERLEILLQEFNLMDIRKQYGDSLSGGQRRRVEVARAVAGNLRFILMDEPLASIDPLTKYEICNLLLQLKKKGLGILISDHNVREIFGIIDRAYVVFEGTLIKQGAPDEVIEDERVRNVFLGEDFHMIRTMKRIEGEN